MLAGGFRIPLTESPCHFAPARAARPVATLSDPGVFLCVRMPVLARIACSNIEKGVYQIFPMRNSVQVQRVTTGAHVATMMDFLSVGNLTNEILIGNAVGACPAVVESNLPVSNTALAPLPDPASGIGINLNLIQKAGNRRGWLAKAGGYYYIGHADIAPKPT